MEAGELPAGWLATTLGDVATWSSGGTPSRSRPEYFRGNIPWIKTGELGTKYIRNSEERISETAVAHSSAKVFPKGAVGIAMYGATIGKLSIWGIDAATNQACAVGVCGEALNNEFLYYFLASEKQNLIKAGKGGAQPNISQGIIKEWPLNLPPLAEQHRIVAKIEELFSELDQGVVSLKTAREQLKVYRQSLLKNAFEGKLTATWRAEHRDQLETAAALQQRIAHERVARYQQQLADWQSQGKPGPKPKPPKPLPPLTAEELAELPELPAGWGWVKLADIGNIETGTTPSKSKPENFGGKFPFFKPTDLDAGDNVRIAREYLTEAGLSESRFLPKNSVLVTCIGATIGKVGISRVDGTSNQQINAVVPLGTNPDFVYRQIAGPFFQEEIKANASSTTLPILNKSKFESLAIAVCGLAEQGEIVALLESKLSEADQLDQTLSTALQQADALRQSILKKAFCGALVKQDKNDEPATALLERIRAAQGTAKTSLGVRGRKPKSNVQNLHIAFNDPEIPGSSFAGHQE